MKGLFHCDSNYFGSTILNGILCCTYSTSDVAIKWPSSDHFTVVLGERLVFSLLIQGRCPRHSVAFIRTRKWWLCRRVPWVSIAHLDPRPWRRGCARKTRVGRHVWDAAIYISWVPPCRSRDKRITPSVVDRCYCIIRGFPPLSLKSLMGRRPKTNWLRGDGKVSSLRNKAVYKSLGAGSHPQIYLYYTLLHLVYNNLRGIDDWKARCSIASEITRLT